MPVCSVAPSGMNAARARRSRARRRSGVASGSATGARCSDRPARRSRSTWSACGCCGREAERARQARVRLDDQHALRVAAAAQQLVDRARPRAATASMRAVAVRRRGRRSPSRAAPCARDPSRSGGNRRERSARRGRRRAARARPARRSRRAADARAREERERSTSSAANTSSRSKSLARAERVQEARRAGPGRAGPRACRRAARARRLPPRCRSPSSAPPPTARRRRGLSGRMLRHLGFRGHPGRGAYPRDQTTQPAERGHAVPGAPRDHARAAGHEQAQVAAPDQGRERREDAQVDAQRFVARDDALEERDRERAISPRVCASRSIAAGGKLEFESASRRAPRPAPSPRAPARGARSRRAGAGSGRCCTPRPRAAQRRASTPGGSETAPQAGARSDPPRPRRPACALHTSETNPGTRDRDSRAAPPMPSSCASCCPADGPPQRRRSGSGWGRAPRRRTRAPHRKAGVPAGAAALWHGSCLCGSLAATARGARPESGGTCSAGRSWCSGARSRSRGPRAPRRRTNRRAPRWGRSSRRSRSCCRRASTRPGLPIRRSAPRSRPRSTGSRPAARSSRRTAAVATPASGSYRAPWPATPRRSAGATPMDASTRRASCSTSSPRIASPATRACRVRATRRSGSG